MKENKSSYSCMYLVPKDIYEKLLQVIDERENRQLRKLNVIGNEEGAFPNLLPGPPGGPDWPGPGGRSYESENNSRAEDPYPSHAVSEDDSPDAPQPFNYSDSSSSRSDVNMVSVGSAGANVDRVSPPGLSETAPTAKKFRHICDLCWAAFQNRKDYETHRRDHYRRMGDLIIHNYDSLPSTGIVRTDIDSNSKLAQLPAPSKNLESSVEYTDGPNLPSVSPTVIPTQKNDDWVQLDYDGQDADNESSGSELELSIQDLICHLCSKQFTNLKLLKKHLYYCKKKNCSAKLKQRKKTSVKARNIRKMKTNLKIAAKHTLKTSDSNQKVGLNFIKQFQCAYCPFTFSVKNSLDRHLLNAHEISNNGAPLFSQGEKRDAEKANLKNHNPTKVLKTEPYICNLCGLVLKSRLLLKSHLVNKHKHKSTKDGNLFSCSICKTFFSAERMLVRHLLNIHECDKNYKSVKPQGVKRTKSHLSCHECSEKFAMLFDLENHVKKKHGASKRYSSWI